MLEWVRTVGRETGAEVWSLDLFHDYDPFCNSTKEAGSEGLICAVYSSLP
jgi:hypothetical protein